MANVVDQPPIPGDRFVGAGQQGVVNWGIVDKSTKPRKEFVVGAVQQAGVTGDDGLAVCEPRMSAVTLMIDNDR